MRNGRSDETSDPNNALEEGEKYEGVATDALTVKDVTLADQDGYFCKVTVDANARTLASPAGLLIINRMVGHWPLDGNADDEFGNNGSAVGTVAYDDVDNVEGSHCLYLDNIPEEGQTVSISYIEAAHVADYSEDVFTVSCWVKSLSPGFATEHNSGGAVSKTDKAGDGPGWSMRKDGLGYRARWFVYGPGGLNSDEPIYFMHLGEWHHLVGVYDEENDFMAMYIDGKLEVSGAVGDNRLLVADGKLYIGADYRLYSPGDLLIDDVRLYNYSLDKFEIGQLYADVANKTVCVENPQGDLDNDCDVDINDLVKLAGAWLDCGMAPDCL